MTTKMKKQILYTIFMLCLFGKLCSQTFTPYETYTYSRTYLEPVTYNSSNANANNSAKQVQSVQYTDGLGRPKQDIAIRATYGGNDMVSAYFYDPVTGRQTKQYLPVTKTTAQGGLQTVSEADVNSYYGVTNAFAEVKTEDSPLSRPIETAAPGDAWQMTGGKTKKVEYLFNGQDEVKKYTATSDDDENVFYPNIFPTSYSQNTLHKIKSTDEDNNVSIAYKNSMGQTLMTRQENGAENLDTYYVYNQYGQLTMIIPPKASALPLTQDVKDQLCYIYRYDAKGRLIEKKLPGKGLEQMVYDKADRLILYRDAKMTAEGKWLITKYDKFGRVLYTGFYPNIARADIQNIIADMVIVEHPDGAGFIRNGLQIYYSNDYFLDISTVLSVNYYDTYPTGSPAKPAAIPEVALSSDNLADRSTKTLPTASYVKNISDDNWTRTYYWYDQRGRSIGAQEINHLGGVTTTHTELDWAGITKKVETKHQRLSTSSFVTVKERFVYNDRNYLEEHYHQVNSNTEELLAKYTYNELGQVTNKQVGNNLQSIDYGYNIRGWLTNINDVNTLGNKLFAYKINYAEREGLETPNLDFPNYKVQPRYNGNITETSWKAVDVGGQVNYSTPERQGFVYDKANRITAGFYQLPDNPATKGNSEIIENYDKNGNIINLKRTGNRLKGQVKMIDNLTYNVPGNRLMSVTDAANNASGYEGGGGAISYDANGNMTAMADKGISAISYNFLNLPETIQQTNVSTFSYRADGVKLRKRFVLNNEAGSNTFDTDYLDGFVYTTTRNAVLREALELKDPATVAVTHARQEEIFTEPEPLVIDPGNPVDMNLSLAYFPTAEGYYDYTNSRYIYQYKDHLGNVRLSYTSNNGSAEVLDRNDYYPFGMNMQGSVSAFDTTGAIANNKYNQKELQETGFYDYGWRQYMPDLGRWFGMDQLSEKYHKASPYAYVMNNPVMMYDPDGRDMEMPGWLRKLWDATSNNQVTNFGGFDSSGNPSSISFGGSFSPENSPHS
jgi:RHS repeat-associated protein